MFKMNLNRHTASCEKYYNKLFTILQSIYELLQIGKTADILILSKFIHITRMRMETEQNIE